MSKNWLVSREAIEIQIGRKLTEDEWQEIADEVAGRLGNFLNEIMEGIIEKVTA